MSEHVRVAIVGSGFSGLCMAIKLKEAGIEDFLVFEKAASLGGTWRDNHYPGCACDIPSYLYSYSFAPSSDWTRMYAEHHEIRAYLERCGAELRGKMRFDTELVRSRFEHGRWHLEAKDGRRWSADILVSAVGGLSRPQLANIPGLSEFQGPHFHSAAWNHDVDLDGARVGVIGTGASAIQFVPHVAKRAGKLHLFQRTPPWIIPKVDRPFTKFERAVLKHVRPLAWLYRMWIYWTHEMRATAFVHHTGILRFAQKLALKHLRSQVKTPALIEKLTPNYSLGCKRILISNDYYPALEQPNVELVTDSIERITPRGVITRDGVEREVDVLISGTGFAVHDYLGPMEVYGTGGRSLKDAWSQGAEAYLGTTVAGFPNLFVLTGPNTGLGHSSMVFMAESQVTYVMGAIREMQRKNIAAVDVRPEVMADFNVKLQERLAKTIWNSGCASWYRDANGKNTTLWPGFTFAFRARTRRFDVENYHLTEKLELCSTSTSSAIAGPNSSESVGQRSSALSESRTETSTPTQLMRSTRSGFTMTRLPPQRGNGHISTTMNGSDHVSTSTTKSST